MYLNPRNHVVADQEYEMWKIKLQIKKIELEKRRIDAHKEIRLAELRLRSEEAPAPSGNSGLAAGLRGLGIIHWRGALNDLGKRYGMFYLICLTKVRTCLNFST